MIIFFLNADSPGIPPSATAHELFRGFSFIAPALLESENITPATEYTRNNENSLAKVPYSTTFVLLDTYFH